MSCSMSQSRKPCGMVWRDGLCYKCWHEHTVPTNVERPRPLERKHLHPDGVWIGETPGRQERAIAASRASRQRP